MGRVYQITFDVLVADDKDIDEVFEEIEQFISTKEDFINVGSYRDRTDLTEEYEDHIDLNL